ncbi:citrate lyase acyl carrier protein [Enterococcus caccae]|uniref:Citrate lyase acyl carrier protein n=1 Tax=Enterococcus caccae ATCC BAA-1240 TaxID=1158612 RepID=R3TX90_9ENTE|nr:citrate lyase acyl carrier protein [Enterococcus caccae]EOL45748.1 citrate lyase acyl carrier protein [Enterococcus caccae ATCC BAA-1240]EOT60944.1 citrate lyase acyl carrier protein [Enterococcus caccae ATCC BAA-1240]
MEIKQNASAGTTESSDILITLAQNDAKGIHIDLDSSVEKQFGRQIRAKIQETLEKLAVTNVKVNAVDKGALDCTIEARTIAAVYRAAGEEMIDWQVIQSWNV